MVSYSFGSKCDVTFTSSKYDTDTGSKSKWEPIKHDTEIPSQTKYDRILKTERAFKMSRN